MAKEKYFKDYAIKYFDMAMNTEKPLQPIIVTWNALTDTAATPEARETYAQYRNAAVAAYNVGMYCDLCNAIYTRTKKGYKLDIAWEGVFYFYSLSALWAFVDSTLTEIPLATIAEYKEGGAA